MLLDGRDRQHGDRRFRIDCGKALDGNSLHQNFRFAIKYPSACCHDCQPC